MKKQINSIFALPPVLLCLILIIMDNMEYIETKSWTDNYWKFLEEHLDGLSWHTLSERIGMPLEKLDEVRLQKKTLRLSETAAVARILQFSFDDLGFAMCGHIYPEYQSALLFGTYSDVRYSFWYNLRSATRMRHMTWKSLGIRTGIDVKVLDQCKNTSKDISFGEALMLACAAENSISQLAGYADTLTGSTAEDDMKRRIINQMEKLSVVELETLYKVAVKLKEVKDAVDEYSKDAEKKIK